MEQPTAVLPAVVAPAQPEPVPAEPTRPRPAWPGILSFALGLLTAGGLTTGIVLATSDLFQEATYAAWASVGLGALAVAAGVVALLLRRSRGLAVAGIVLGFVANPLVITPSLTAIGGLWA